MANTFRYWMEEETKHARDEQEAVRRNDHAAAATAHRRRWNCLDMAREVLEGKEKSLSSMTANEIESKVGIEPQDVAKANDGYQTLGPAYFAARRIAEKLFKNDESMLEGEQSFKKIVDEVVEKVREGLYDYVEGHILSDLECNVQGKVYHLVDDTVKALLTGERWALERYVLAQEYNSVHVRKAVAAHIPDELAKARIADLEKQIEQLKTDLAREREWNRR